MFKVGDLRAKGRRKAIMGIPIDIGPSIQRNTAQGWGSEPTLPSYSRVLGF